MEGIRNEHILIKLKELRCEAAEWSQLTQDTVLLQPLVKKGL
jgi:hypothetical protein